MPLETSILGSLFYKALAPGPRPHDILVWKERLGRGLVGVLIHRVLFSVRMVINFFFTLSTILPSFYLGPQFLYTGFDTSQAQLPRKANIVPPKALPRRGRGCFHPCLSSPKWCPPRDGWLPLRPSPWSARWRCFLATAEGRGTVGRPLGGGRQPPLKLVTGRGKGHHRLDHRPSSASVRGWWSP